MTRILLAFCTVEGQSRKIADVLADEARALGHQVEMLDVSLPHDDVDIASFDGYVVGGSVHRMHHEPALITFVIEHAHELDAKPSAFFSVSLAAGSEDAQGREDAALLAQDFFRETGWHPTLFDTVAGALLYSKYSPAIKQAMRFIAWVKHAPTDASHDYEMTDWDGVRRFARDIVRTIEHGATTAPDSPLDRQLRFYDVGLVRESPRTREAAWRAAVEADLRSDVIASALDQVRDLVTSLARRIGRQSETTEDTAPLTLEHLLTTGGSPFQILDEEEGAHLVLGAVGRFWSPKVEWASPDPQTFAALESSEQGKIVVGLRAQPATPEGTRLRLELRLSAPDDAARRQLRAYWMLIGPALGFAVKRVLDVLADA